MSPGEAFNTAHWEIRSGVSSGTGGTLIGSGDVPIVRVANGQNSLGLLGEFDLCSTPPVVLGPGTYWFSCAPHDSGTGGSSFESGTSDVNVLGSHVENCPPADPGCAFWTQTAPGTAAFQKTTAVAPGAPTEFSFGVIGTTLTVPLPATIVLVGSSLVGLAGLAWRRRRDR